MDIVNAHIVEYLLNVTPDRDDTLADMEQYALARTFPVVDALKLIDEVEGQFDIIFNDIDKHQYPRAFRKAVPRLRRGGLLITDNALWSGKVLNHKPDSDTAGILTYNRLIYSSKELFTTIIPLRDGVSVSVKL